MSSPAKRILRVAFGLAVGLIGGSVVGVALILLLLVVCIAAGGDYNGPNETALAPIFAYTDYAISALAILAGTVLGVRWAIRRNRRDDANEQRPG